MKLFLILTFEAGSMTATEWEKAKSDIQGFAYARMIQTGGKLLDAKAKPAKKRKP
jgi:hypothetical protein